MSKRWIIRQTVAGEYIIATSRVPYDVEIYRRPIFEVAVFPDEDVLSLDDAEIDYFRFDTYEEAMECHDEWIKEYQA